MILNKLLPMIFAGMVILSFFNLGHMLFQRKPTKEIMLRLPILCILIALASKPAIFNNVGAMMINSFVGFLKLLGAE